MNWIARCSGRFPLLVACISLGGCGSESELECDPSNNGSISIQLQGGNVLFPMVTTTYNSAELKPWTLRQGGNVDDQWWLHLFALSDYVIPQQDPTCTGEGCRSSMSLMVAGPPTAGQVYTLSELDTTSVNSERLISAEARIGDGEANFDEESEVARDWTTQEFSYTGSLTIESSTRADGGYRDVTFNLEATMAPIGTAAQGDLTVTASGTINACEVPCDSIYCG